MKTCYTFLLQTGPDFIDACKVTTDQINWLAANTKQRGSLLWGRLRRLRLTGSNFGKVLDSYDRNQQKGTPYPLSLFKSLKGEYKSDTKDSIMWGQMNEDIAANADMNKTTRKYRKHLVCVC